MNFAELLLTGFADPEEPFVVYPKEGIRQTRGETLERVYRLVNAFQAVGLNRGDRVAWYSRNHPAYYELLLGLGVIEAGMPHINYHFKGEELVYALGKDFHHRFVVVDEALWPNVEAVLASLDHIEGFIVLGDVGHPRVLSGYEALLSASSPTRPKTGLFGRLPLWLMTGGSTGKPKGMNTGELLDRLIKGSIKEGRLNQEKTRDLMLRGMATFLYHTGLHRIENLVSAVCIPMYHAATAPVFLPPFLFGGSFVIMNRFEPEAFLKLIETERISFSFLTPIHLHRILQLPDGVKSRYDLSSMQAISCSAAPCPTGIKPKINELFLSCGAKGPVFYEIYSSSDGGYQFVLKPEHYQNDPKKYETQGFPYGCNVKIFDEETGRVCAPYEIGTLYIQSLTIANLSYEGDPEKTRSAFRQIEGEWWFNEGELAYLDNEGFLHVVARAKDVIISGGINIWPIHIEEVFLSHPKVADVAVIGMPDAEYGESVMAVIQPKAKGELSIEELEAFAQERLSGYQRPKVYVLTDTLPRHADGKILKREVRRMFLEQNGPSLAIPKEAL